jgi:scyllo-inositol 2-dehydrogenase (NADP+)
MQQINTGIIGYGMSARVFHAPFIHANPKFKISKIVERHNQVSKEDYPYVDVVTSTDDLLYDESIQLIVITTPNKSHYPLAKKALLAGKHVIIEKPFTISSKEADDLISISDETNLILSVYHNRRWDGDFLTVKNILNQGYLGKVVEYESHFDRFRNYFKRDAWRENNVSGSGILYDLGPHLIDHALQLFGNPNEITADIRIQREGGQTDDQFEVKLHYDKLKATLKAGMLVREPSPRFLLYGTQGTFIKYGLDPQEADSKSGMIPIHPRWGVDNQSNWGTLNTNINGLHFRGNIETLRGCYQKFYENIFEAITNKEDLAVKPEEARDVIKIIELAFQSSREKKTVPFQ